MIYSRLPSVFSFIRPAFSAVVLTCAVFSATAESAPPVLMQGASVSVTTQDVEAEMQRMPPDIRQRIGADPKMLQQLIDSIYLRRALAVQAEHHGLLKNPQTVYKLSVARENTLLEAELQRVMDAVTPAPEALERQILSIYKAEPERFKTPDGSATKPFEEVKEQLRAETLAKLQQAARAKAVEQLRAQAQGDSAALDAFVAAQKAPAQ